MEKPSSELPSHGDFAPHRASRALRAIAFVWLTFPVTYLVVAAILYDIPLGRCIAILLSPGYYLISALAIVAGFGLWEIKRWGWYVFQVAVFLTIYQSANLVVNYGETNHKVLAFLFSVALLAAITYRVAREMRVPYFFPKLRWWESNSRFRFAAPISVIRDGRPAIDCEVLDLSVGGCFIKCREDFGNDEVVRLRFTVFGNLIDCEGMVVWRAMSTVTHPKGVGVKFLALKPHEKKALRASVKRLRKMSALYRRSRYLTNQEEFVRRWNALQFAAIHGKGAAPVVVGKDTGLPLPGSVGKSDAASDIDEDDDDDDDDDEAQRS